jgi:hypothetical protein
MLTIKLNAPNDVYGNPQRCWLLISGDSGAVIDVVDEGYFGYAARPKRVTEGPEISVTQAEYRGWIRFGESLGTGRITSE